MASSAASSSSAMSHSVPIVSDTLTMSQKTEYQIKMLSENCIYIPFRYVFPMIENGSLDSFVKIIEDVNEQEEKNMKRWDDEVELWRIYEKSEKKTVNKRKEGEKEVTEENRDVDDGPSQKKIKTVYPINLNKSVTTEDDLPLTFIGQSASNKLNDTMPI